jgi:hypothetical protein
MASVSNYDVGTNRAIDEDWLAVDWLIASLHEVAVP